MNDQGRRIINSSSSGWPRLLASIEKDGTTTRPDFTYLVKVEVMAKEASGVLAVGGGPVLRASDTYGDDLMDIPLSH